MATLFYSSYAALTLDASMLPNILTVHRSSKPNKKLIATDEQLARDRTGLRSSNILIPSS